MYINPAMVICLTLLKQLTCCAFIFDRAKAGRSRAARIPMIVMTTSNSMSVNALH